MTILHKRFEFRLVESAAWLKRAGPDQLDRHLAHRAAGIGRAPLGLAEQRRKTAAERLAFGIIHRRYSSPRISAARLT